MKNGVDHYTTGTAVVDVHFPNDDVVCKHCWLFLRCDTDLRRYRCKLTGEPIPDPQHNIGLQCPLIFKDPPCEERADQKESEDRA